MESFIKVSSLEVTVRIINLIVTCSLFAFVNLAVRGASAASEPIPKLQFRQQFEKGMLKGFCEESKFTFECYDMDKSTCEANVKSSLAKCLQENPGPEMISKEKTVGYGIKIGRCIGTDFQNRNKSKLRKVPECQNPIGWLGK